MPKFDFSGFGEPKKAETTGDEEPKKKPFLFRKMENEKTEGEKSSKS